MAKHIHIHVGKKTVDASAYTAVFQSLKKAEQELRLSVKLSRQLGDNHWEDLQSALADLKNAQNRLIDIK